MDPPYNVNAFYEVNAIWAGLMVFIIWVFRSNLRNRKIFRHV